MISLTFSKHEFLSNLISSMLKLGYTFRKPLESQTIHKPQSQHYPSRSNHRPRDFDSIISGGLDHLKACCTTLRWYLSLVVGASWGRNPIFFWRKKMYELVEFGRMISVPSFLFLFFRRNGQNAHVFLALLNAPRNSIKGADGNLYLGKWEGKTSNDTGWYFTKSSGWTSGFM